jgi:hypothetical protein
MKKIISSFIILGFLSAALLTSCDKAKDTVIDNTTNNTTTPTTTPNFGDASGVLSAVRSVTYQTVSGFVIPVTVYTAVAAFPSTPGSSTFADAGTVTLNSKALTKQSNNAYLYQNLSDPLNLNQITWNVTGSGSVPAFSYTDDKSLPDYSGYNDLPGTVTIANGLTVDLAGKVANADSVYVVISSGNSSAVIKRVAGNASSAVFTAQDLAALSTGTGILQVVPWNYKIEDFSGKNYYFVIETAVSKLNVTIN